jgi:hypothetical protein
MSVIYEVSYIEIDANYKIQHECTNYEIINSLFAKNNLETKSDKIKKISSIYSQALITILVRNFQ